jgi:hypothetical protein
MNIYKYFRPFLKPTADEKVPTDVALDDEIRYVSDLLHHLSPRLKRIVYRKIGLFFLYRWKYLVGRLFIFTVIVVPSYLLFTTITNLKVNLTPKDFVQDTIIRSYPSDSSMNLRNYLLQIAYVESRYNKRAHRDSSQYWGLYQIGTEARRLAGYGDVPMNVYLHHPEIQDFCMVNLLKYEKKYTQKYINKYSGKIIDGILVTESGFLALCHLGVGFAQSCMDKGIVPEDDGFGNPARVYLKLGGYKLNLEKVKYSIEDAL